MEIREHVATLLRQATSPAAALQAATRAIGEALHAESCAIFLLRSERRLVIASSYGPPLDERADAIAALALKRVQPVLSSDLVRTVLSAPMLERADPIGAVVVERASVNAYTIEDGKVLAAVAAQLVDVLDNTRLLEFIGGTINSPSGDDASQETPTGELILKGTPASPGIAIGTASFRQTFPRSLVRRGDRSQGESSERERARDAFQKTRNDLFHLQATAATQVHEEHALIFASHLLLLGDPMLEERVEARIRAGNSAAMAIDWALEEIVLRLRNISDPYIRERIEDIEDVRCRVLSHVLGAKALGSLRKQVVISPRTTPSLIIELKVQGAIGIASEIGSSTSHGVLLARALGVPAVTGLPELLTHVSTNDELIVDGDDGTVILRPSASTMEEYRSLASAGERKRTQFLMYRHRAAKTADGVQVKLQANVALGLDLELARDNGAQGIGLYRTEFPFIARDRLPTVEEQVRIYARAYQVFPRGPISFRVLDLAGDKFLTGGDLGVARNAFHGYRSIRILFDYPHILRDQVQAFAIAAAGQPLKILIPMVTSVEDVVRVKQLIADALAELSSTEIPAVKPNFGVMIEVPAAVEIVGELAEEVDFFSIGTNDLMQYAMVIDREDSRISSPRDAYHPALLRMIHRVIGNAHKHSKEVGVCGEIAARPEVAAALIALGVDSLSVTPRAIPELKQKLAAVRIKPLAADIERLLAAKTSTAVEQILRSHLSQDAPPSQT